jgi:hypothetical protein
MGLDLNILINSLNSVDFKFTTKFWNRTHFETSMNFKGIQTLWEKSGNFTKILSPHDLRKSKFSGAHLYAKIWSSNTRVKMN